MTDTGPCENCGAEVSLDAIQCPDCGYAPAELLRAKAVALAALPVFLLSLALVVTGSIQTPVFAYDPAPSEVWTFALPAVFVSGALLVGYRRQDNRRPTDSTVF